MTCMYCLPRRLIYNIHAPYELPEPSRVLSFARIEKRGKSFGGGNLCENNPIVPLYRHTTRTCAHKRKTRTHVSGEFCMNKGEGDKFSQCFAYIHMNLLVAWC